jgi:hypothetical protein
VAIIYLCVTSTHFHDVEFVISLCVGDPLQLKGTFPSRYESVQATLNPQMASPCFPFSHVSSKIPLSHEKDKGHPPLMGTTNNQ